MPLYRVDVPAQLHEYRGFEWSYAFPMQDDAGNVVPCVVTKSALEDFIEPAQLPQGDEACLEILELNRSEFEAIASTKFDDRGVSSDQKLWIDTEDVA
ncbi:hypothetical protein CHELA1G11_11200 [Hyphomicrobiales bacterium]|nr:hypothetical protein CHELA1G11_11200 [Hyphomicrobiales bacterium]CAH1669430.1 hypothetical protein CHELA1G2_13109 [Hyphomicrobiales bacterium]